MHIFLLQLLLFKFMTPQAHGQDNVSDLLYQPSKNELATNTQLSQTKLNASFSKITLVNTGTVFSSPDVEIEQTVITQTLQYGLLPWLSVSVDVPYIFKSSTKVDDGSPSSNTKISSKLTKSNFVLHLGHGDRSGIRGLLSMGYRQNDSLSPGLLKLSYGVRSKRSRFMTLIRFNIESFNGDGPTEDFRTYSLDFASQSEMTYGFFIRSAAKMAYSSEITNKSNGQRFRNNYEIMASVNIGQELSTSHFYWLLGVDYSYAKSSIIASNNFESPDIETDGPAVNFEFGFKF